MERRIINTEINSEIEEKAEISIRPISLNEYVGQSKIKKTIDIYIKAAKKRNEALDHVLLYGPPGLGKTTLAMIIAHEMNANIKITSGPVIEKPGTLAAIIKKLKDGDILFIDEIHRLNKQVEEILYPAMEDFKIDLILENSADSRPIRLRLPRFTLIGATTKAGVLGGPLRDRFGIVNSMEYYNIDELDLIIKNTSKKLGIAIENDASVELAKRSRGTPRLANRILRRIRDFAEVENKSVIDLATTNKALDLLDIDSAGLDNLDRKILSTIIDFYKGGPVGIDAIATTLAQEKDSIEDIYEPYLVQKGFIARSPRGRIATDKAYAHLGLSRE